MNMIPMNKKFNYPLTVSFKSEGECWRECRGIIEQIEKYEGRNKGFDIREENGKWAVYTSGDLAKEEFCYPKDGDKAGGETNLLQYRDILRRVR